MILGRNVEQGHMLYHIQEWQLCLSYFCCYLPLLYLTVIMHWFRVHSVTQIPLEYVNGTWEKCRTRWDDVLHTRIATVPSLLLALSPFVIFDNDYALGSVSRIPFRTFWSYLVEMQNRTRWYITYKWHLWLSFFWSYLPLFCFWN